MNKKGFTLIELLGVVVVLALLTLIIVPIVNGIIRDSKGEISEANINTILDSAYNWSLKNSSKLPDTVGTEVYVSVDTLKKEGYLKKDIYDVLKNSKYNDACQIRIMKVSYGDDLEKIENSKYFNDYLFIFDC